MNYYIYIGAVFIILGLLLTVVGIVKQKAHDNPAEATQETALETERPLAEVTQEAEPSEVPAANEVEEPSEEEPAQTIDSQPDNETKIHDLIEDYYTAYASGDTGAIEKYATPVSELEKSYIKLMSKYTEATNNIQCHISDGLNEGEYAVSVMADTKLAGIEPTAPGLDFFYVRTNKDGICYIDNLYSSFNLSVHVSDTDDAVTDFITDYESRDEFKVLQKDVQTRYDEVLAANADLKDKLTIEIPQAVNEWMTVLASSGDKKAGKTDDTNNVIPGTKLTATDSYNIRESMKEDAKKIGSTKEGDKLLVIKNHENGWTEIKWKEHTGYIKTKLLIGNES